MRTDPKISLKEIEKIDRITRLNRPFTDEEIEQLRKLPNILKDLVPSLKGKRKGGIVSRKKGSAVASKKRKKSIPYPRKFPDDPGAAHPDYEQKNPYLKGKQKKAKGGTVSRRSGGKIMQGYKAGGKV